MVVACKRNFCLAKNPPCLFFNRLVHNWVTYFLKETSFLWRSGLTGRLWECWSAPLVCVWTYAKDILSRSTKNTVTELLINRICQLTLYSHNNIWNHRWMAKPPNCKVEACLSSRVSNVCYKRNYDNFWRSILILDTFLCNIYSKTS